MGARKDGLTAEAAVATSKLGKGVFSLTARNDFLLLSSMAKIACG
jgi:hypothetical protein